MASQPDIPTAVLQAEQAVTLEIIAGKLQSTTEEMAVIVRRTSMCPIVYEVLDYACGICDANADLVAQSHGITLFTGTFKRSVQALVEKFGDGMRAGDVYLINDPFDGGGSHLNDVAAVRPVFIDGSLFAFAIVIAHWTEVGGMVPGSLSPESTEIHQEGLRFTGVRVYRGDQRNDDVFDLIAANVRLPTMTLGDLNAEVAAVRLADTRLQETCKRYGAEVVRASFEQTLSTSERMSREAILALPDGVYEAEDAIDGTGLSDDPLPVRVRVIIESDEIVFDFTGSSPQQPGPGNCTMGSLLSSVKTVFKALVAPHAPSNEGWFRPLHIVAPEGSIFNARFPAPVGWYFEASIMASELIWKALASYAPDRFSVGHYMSASVAVFYGILPDSEERFVLVEPHAGGWGASHDGDGTSVLCPTVDGDTQNYSVELLEARHPIRCTHYGLNTGDGAGAGRYRGGFGVDREYEILIDEAFVYGSLARSVDPPWGLNGGTRGSPNYFLIDRPEGRIQRARLRALQLRRGDRVAIRTGSGGGYGAPHTRPATEVLADVSAGYLDPDEAEAIYGVVVRADGSVDAAATERRRDGRA